VSEIAAVKGTAGNREKTNRWLLPVLIGVPLLAMFVSLFVGKYSASPADIAGLIISRLLPFIHHETTGNLATAILQVRLPRILLAMLVGMSLAIAGSSFQGLFRNPLVSSQILGVSSGASFGAALAIVLSQSALVIQLSAFIFGLAAVGLALLIVRFYHASPTLTLVLAGVVIGSLFGSLVSLITYTADPNIKLPAIVFWLMGSLASSANQDLVFALPPMLVGITVLLLIRWRINVLSMGEEEAKALGVNTDRLRLIIVLCATMITSAAVSVSGVIGWIGLVIPHFGRILVGPDHKMLLPTCLSLGGTYLLLMDNIARTATSAEIPIGIITGIIGAPVFAYLLTRGARWS
jgi:iron complex transport system permease protein